MAVRIQVAMSQRGEEGTCKRYKKGMVPRTASSYQGLETGTGTERFGREINLACTYTQ